MKISEKWIRRIPVLSATLIACCLLGYVIPQNKGGEVAVWLVAIILLFFFILIVLTTQRK